MPHYRWTTPTPDARVQWAGVIRQGETRHLSNGRIVAVHPHGEKCKLCPGGDDSSDGES